MRRSSNAFQPTWASPPGETISDILMRQRLTVLTFAKRMGLNAQEAHGLLRGEVPLTESTAQLLEQTIGGSATFWRSRETQFREDEARLRETETIAEKKAWLRELPLRDMRKFGWVSAHSSVEDQISACLRYFGVSTLDAWQNKYRALSSVVAFRTSGTFESNPSAVSAWFRQGEIEAESIKCSDWNLEKFRSILPDLRSLSRKKSPEAFIPELKKRCADCGVVVAVVRAPAGCRASGATKFLAPNRALLLLSFRYKSDDHFWFTFFHEAGHLVLHSDKGVFVEGADMLTTGEEDEANEFAAELLIPSHYQTELPLIVGEYRDVMRFARRIGVSPGIVVGQLQHRGLLARNEMNYLKYRYAWIEGAERN